MAYRITDAATCSGCIHYSVCTNSKSGRKIVRLTRVEHPFGHMKRNLGMTDFLLRGREGAQAEISIATTCFNIVRMITLIGGVKELMGQVVALQS